MTNRAMNSSGIVNVADLRRMAQRRVPKSVFDYLDGGTESEITLSENCRAFRDVTFDRAEPLHSPTVTCPMPPPRRAARLGFQVAASPMPAA
jgi:hypothetical protein